MMMATGKKHANKQKKKKEFKFTRLAGGTFVHL